jgi:hypothetical protein
MRYGEFDLLSIEGTADNYLCFNDKPPYNKIPIVQGLITVHTNSASNDIYMVLRDGTEKPIVAVKFSRKRWAWFLKNQFTHLLLDFQLVEKAISMLIDDEIIDKSVKEQLDVYYSDAEPREEEGVE